MPEMTQNGENLVKVSTNQAGKMRNFFKKVAKGLKKVLYAPGAIFEALKDVPKAAKYRIVSKIEEQEKLKEEVNKTAESNKKASSKGGTLPEPVTEAGSASKDEDSNKQEDIRVIQGTPLSSKNIPKQPKKKDNDGDDKKTKENAPAMPIEINKPSQPTKNTQEETDTSVLGTSIEEYGDLRRFASWEEYYSSFSEKERMKQMKNGDLLTDSEFTEARLFQAEETIRLCEAKEAIRQTEKARLLEEENTRQKQKEANQNEKKDLEDRIKEIDEEQARLNTESRKNKSQVRALDKQSQEDEKLKSNMKKITEPKTNEKTREEKIEDEVERRMNKINSNFEANETLSHESSDEKTTRTLISNPAEPQVTDSKNASHSITDSTVIQDNQEDSLVTELSNFESPTKVGTENKSNDNSKVLVSTNSDNPGNITINNDDFNMGFDNETRAEVGQRAQEIKRSSNGTIPFQDALTQAAQEFSAETESKGKTR